MRLRVDLHDQRVGSLTLSHGDRSEFSFDPSYFEVPERPLLGRAFEDSLTTHGAARRYVGVQGRLPVFFSNYLPELDSALRRFVAAHAGVKQHHEFALIRVLGGDLPGAVVVREESGDSLNADLFHEASEGQASMPADDRPLRFSLAGVQLKFSVLRDDDRIVLPVTGQGGRWILKLPDRLFPNIPETEHATMTWARAAGIATPDFELVERARIAGLPSEVDIREPYAYLIARYDRPPEGGRVHQEDFVQVLEHADDKYEGVRFERLARIIHSVCGADDFDEFLRRLVFMVLSRNADAHLKNWSLYYPDRRRPRLSPAYDLLTMAGLPADYHQGLALPLEREKDFTRITREHFGRLIDHAGADGARGRRVLDDAITRTRMAWRDLRGELRLSKTTVAALDAHLDSVRL